MTGMADDILPMEASGHPELRFQRILDDSTIQDFAELNCVSYDVPVETSLSLVKEHTLLAQACIWVCRIRREQASVERNCNHQRRLPLSVSGSNDTRSTVQGVWGSSGATGPTDTPRSDWHQ
jgi:hypothetical protein